jgi:hypothetical protein
MTIRANVVDLCHGDRVTDFAAAKAAGIAASSIKRIRARIRLLTIRFMPSVASVRSLPVCFGAPTTS